VFTDRSRGTGERDGERDGLWDRGMLSGRGVAEE
jgi:hypothetical protein